MATGAVRRLVVWAVAVILCLLGVLATLAVWAVGLGHYLEDLCLLSPAVDAREGEVVRGPSLEWPDRLRCSFVDSGRPDVVTTDWAPLLWTGCCAFAALVGVVVVVLVARRLSAR